MTILGSNYYDHAGTILSGGTAQDVADSNIERKGFFFYNESDTDMRINFGNINASATVGLLIEAGYYWEPPVVPVQKATVYCATTGKAYSCGEWE